MQTRSHLQTIQGLPAGLRDQIQSGKLVLETIDLRQWAQGTGPLESLGAGPCLNVVVHNASQPQHSGCIAHVFNYTLNQRKLYQTACQTIQQMLVQARVAATDELDIWLGSGYAFFPGSPKIREEPVAQPFPEVLAAFLTQQRVAMDTLHIDGSFLRKESRGFNFDAPDPGDIIYLPASATVYVLNGADRTLLKEGQSVVQQPATHLHQIAEIN